MGASGEIFVGLMSGTSVDGVDAALVKFHSAKKLEVIATQFTEFDGDLRQAINHLAQNNHDLTDCADSPLHDDLANVYARATLDLLEKAKVDKSSVKGIANHGQTVKHEPNATPPYSLQLGNAQLIANLTGISCYAQFRQADLAHGGQGAPLMPAFHSAVFGDAAGSMVLNIGGIANISKLGDTVIGFDTGPGNTLLDQWIGFSRGQRYDHDGSWAKSGKVVPSLLEDLLNDPYFEQNGPKSTGTDYFNLAWLGDVSNYPPQDVQATLLALTVTTITDSVRNLAPEGSTIYVCGGGAANPELMSKLSKSLNNHTIAKTDQLGVPSDWVEAVGFAWLGYCREHQHVSNLPSVTGASKALVLGDIFYPEN